MVIAGRSSRMAARASGFMRSTPAARPPSPSVPRCLCGEYERASKLRARLSQEATLCGARDAGIHHRDTEAQRGTEILGPSTHGNDLEAPLGTTVAEARPVRITDNRQRTTSPDNAS